MFKVAGFKVRFQRMSIDVFIASLDATVRRDVTICNIYEVDTLYKKHDEIASGVAILNPIDQYDKVTGKKIALTEALSISTQNGNKVHLGKAIRTKIWEAFWEWVDSWGRKVVEEPLEEPLEEPEIVGLKDEQKET